MSSEINSNEFNKYLSKRMKDKDVKKVHGTWREKTETAVKLSLPPAFGYFAIKFLIWYFTD